MTYLEGMMRKVSTAVLAIGAALVGFAWSAAAQASVISFTHTTTTQAVPLTDPFFLPGFNPSLGTLTGVTLQLDTTGTAEVDVINISGGPLPFTNATCSIPVTITGPGPTSVIDTLTAG